MDQRFETLYACIRDHQKFILTAHETPDGDAIGSEIAMYGALRYLNKEVRIFNADPMPTTYNYLDPEKVVTTLDSDDLLPENLSEYVLLILDTNDRFNTGCINDKILPCTSSYFIIDHHEKGNTVTGVNIIENSASSTCEIIYEIISAMQIPVDFQMAEAMYTGIVYDTGSFIYPKTSVRTFEIATELVRRGVVPNKVYTALYESNSISSLCLQSSVLSTLELHCDRRIAVISMPREMLRQCGAAYDEATTLINIPLKSENIRISVFLKENEEGVRRCSMRSKGNINVADIAASYDGGGHKTAAGFKSGLPMEELKLKLLKDLEALLEPA